MALVRSRVFDDETDTQESYTFLLVCIGESCPFRRVVRMRKLFDEDPGSNISVPCLQDEQFRLLLDCCSLCAFTDRALPAKSLIPKSELSLLFAKSRYSLLQGILEPIFEQSLLYEQLPFLSYKDYELVPGLFVSHFRSRYIDLVYLLNRMRSTCCRLQLAVWHVQDTGDLGELEISIILALER